jgi:hypothetical protein
MDFTEASLEGNELTAEGLPENLSYLFLLACERDKAEPRQASVFVGSYTYTRGRERHLNAPAWLANRPRSQGKPPGTAQDSPIEPRQESIRCKM